MQTSKIEATRSKAYLERSAVWLLAPRSTAALLVLSAAIGLIFVLVLFSPAFLAGSSPFWDFPHGIIGGSHADMVTVMVGDIYYVQAPWGLPLFTTHNLDYPGGTNIAMLDAIPLLALLWKAIFHLTGANCNLLGAWIALCFVLNGVATSWLMISGRLTGIAHIACGTVISLQLPALLYRFGHIAHIAWFFFIAVLGIYFFARRARRLSSSAIAMLCLLTWLALLVNSYVFLITAALCITTLVASWLDGALTRRGVLMYSATLIGGTFLLMLVTRHLEYSSVPRPGYTHASLNVIGPITPQLSDIFHVHTMFSTVSSQFDAYNYLGAGILFLILASIAVVLVSRQPVRERLRQVLYRHRVLIGTCMAFIVLAISYRVTIGPYDVLGNIIHVLEPHRVIRQDATRSVDPHSTLEAPMGLADTINSKLFGAVRDAGRLFWPVSYLLLLTAFVVWRRVTRPVIQVVGLVVAAILQTADTSTLRAAVHHEASTTIPWILVRDTWTLLIAARSEVQVYPSYTCGSDADATYREKINLELGVLAARLNRPISNVVLPGVTKHDCHAEAEQFNHLRMSDGALYVFFSALPPDLKEGDSRCRVTSFGTVCTKDWGRLKNAPLAGINAYNRFVRRICLIPDTPYCRNGL